MGLQEEKLRIAVLLEVVGEIHPLHLVDGYQEDPHWIVEASQR